MGIDWLMRWKFRGTKTGVEKTEEGGGEQVEEEESGKLEGELSSGWVLIWVLGFSDLSPSFLTPRVELSEEREGVSTLLMASLAFFHPGHGW